MNLKVKNPNMWFINSLTGMPFVMEGVVWSQSIPRQMPKGVSATEVAK
jgi:hypothetical protein